MSKKVENIKPEGPKISKEDAGQSLSILVQIAEQFRGTKQDHVNIQSAIDMVGKFIEQAGE